MRAFRHARTGVIRKDASGGERGGGSTRIEVKEGRKEGRREGAGVDNPSTNERA